MVSAVRNRLREGSLTTYDAFLSYDSDAIPKTKLNEQTLK